LGPDDIADRIIFFAEMDLDQYFSDTRERIVVCPHKGISFPARDSSLLYGAGEQTVLSLLGSPDEITPKTEDKLKSLPFGVVSTWDPANPQSKSESYQHTDYFYNYFRLGLDILFDGEFHVVRKFILHTNFPINPFFNYYQRCRFEIVEPRLQRQSQPITPLSTWSDIERIFGKEDQKPIDLNCEEHKFGPTHFHGYKNIIFEMTSSDRPETQYIASVCIYEEYIHS
jgi:hypothetical protein